MPGMAEHAPDREHPVLAAAHGAGLARGGPGSLAPSTPCTLVTPWSAPGLSSATVP